MTLSKIFVTPQDHLAPGGEVAEGFNAIRANNDALSIEERIALDQRVAARFSTSPRETTNGKLDVSEAAMNEILCYVFYCAYHRGHEDTVEARYTDVHHSDSSTFWKEDVSEVVSELGIESILTRLTGDPAKRIAELEEDKVRLLDALKSARLEANEPVCMSRDCDPTPMAEDRLYNVASIIDAAMKEQP